MLWQAAALGPVEDCFRDRRPPAAEEVTNASGSHAMAGSSSPRSTCSSGATTATGSGATGSARRREPPKRRRRSRRLGRSRWRSVARGSGTRRPRRSDSTHDDPTRTVDRLRALPYCRAGRTRPRAQRLDRLRLPRGLLVQATGTERVSLGVSVPAPAAHVMTMFTLLVVLVIAVSLLAASERVPRWLRLGLKTELRA